MLRPLRTYRLLPVLLSVSLLGSAALLGMPAECFTGPGRASHGEEASHPCSTDASEEVPAARIAPACLHDGLCCTVQPNPPSPAWMPAVVTSAHDAPVAHAGVLPARVQAGDKRLVASLLVPFSSPRHLLPPHDRQVLFSTFLN